MDFPGARPGWGVLGCVARLAVGQVDNAERGDLGGGLWTRHKLSLPVRPRTAACGPQRSVARPARVDAIADAHCIGSWSTYLFGVELAHILEVAGLAARAAAWLRGRRCCGTISPRSSGIGGSRLWSWGLRPIARQELTWAPSMIAPGVMPEP